MPSILKSALSLKAPVPAAMSFSASLRDFEVDDMGDALDVPAESMPNTAESGVFKASGNGMLTLYHVELASWCMDRCYKGKEW